MKTRTLLSTLIAATVLLAAGGAMAQPAGPRADSNGDGKISRSEAAALPRLAQNFDQLDTNRDGYLTRDEMPRAGKGARRAGQGGGWTQLDANGDGKISRDEAKTRPRLAQNFDQLDSNRDGYLTRNEMPRSGKGGQGGGFARFDSNNDGKLSRDEAKAQPQLAGQFDQIDTNKDGYLTRDEMFSHHSTQRFTQLDSDRNGTLSRTEAAKAPRLAQQFDQIDHNRDGKLSRDEFTQHRPPRTAGQPRSPAAGNASQPLAGQ